MTITKEWAEAFATEWIEAWNAQDLSRVLSHYTDDFEMSSPFIIQFANEPTGRLSGRERVRLYWQAALQRIPHLRFELLHVFPGASSVVLYYRTSFGRLAAEVLFFDEQGLVYRATAHYTDDPG
jgi:hypothetical protein